jgi:hypothetical protein
MIALSLTGASQKRPYSQHENAFDLDDATVQFVLPGLIITINSAKIASDGTISVVCTVTDPNGLSAVAKMMKVEMKDLKSADVQH